MQIFIWDRAVDYHLSLANEIIKEPKQSDRDTPQHRSEGENKPPSARARDRPSKCPRHLFHEAIEGVIKEKNVRKSLQDNHRSIANIATYSLIEVP